jgi:farnesyl-diphosphate farnesyltransferase
MKALGEAEMMKVLKGVSRSFVLTIRALPASLRRPVGLAYLLARASDTIADTASAPIEVRKESLRAFGGMLNGEWDAAFGRLEEIRPENPSERYLLQNLNRVSAALDALPGGDREKIVTLLGKITRGQESDLVKFPDTLELRALGSAEELDEYTYLVAGCVGEFWTRICGAHLPRYGQLQLDELCRLGRNFGQGLQLVNILRDLPEDMARGRCYLPMDELQEAGVTSLVALREDMRAAAPVFEAWRQKALRYHEDARQYIEAIRPWRVRFACLIPWALGARTLKMIGERPPLENRERVKVGRQEVARIMRRAVWGAMSNAAVRRCAES